MIKQFKYCFIDRDGTIINEPEDKQIDSIAKLELMPGVIEGLIRLKKAGYRFVMVSNQDGLGTPSFPEESFNAPHQLLMCILQSQGIEFDEVLICPHLPSDNCDCRKPKLGLVMHYLRDQLIDRKNSVVIGDRESDVAFAENIGISCYQIGSVDFPNWQTIVDTMLFAPRKTNVERKTNETSIQISVNLDETTSPRVSTGVGFFDHMLEQLIYHAGISATISAEGDLYIDDHHTVEDIALTLGEALNDALGDKRGITRYGFLLPMDETLCHAAIDLSGRPHCTVEHQCKRDTIEGFAIEMLAHFFHSLSQSLRASIHLRVTGENDHHQVEACFKAFGRVLQQAIKREAKDIPSTKGVL